MAYTVYQSSKPLATVSAPRAIDAIEEVMTTRLGPEWRQRIGSGLYLLTVRRVLTMEESRSKPLRPADEEDMPMPYVSVSGQQWHR